MRHHLRLFLLLFGLLMLIVPAMVFAQDTALLLTATPSPFVPSPVPTEPEPTVPPRPTASSGSEPRNLGSVSIGETVTGELSGSITAASYTFEGEAGQVVTIGLSSTAFDSYLRLLDPNGVELATDDDGAGSLNSRIGPLTLTENGEYTVIASTFSCSTGGSCNATGAFQLQLSAAQIERIEYTQTVEGELSAEQPAIIYAFTGQQGDVVSVSMTSDDFDSYLTLSSSTPNTELTTNDDGGGSLNALIGPFTLPSTGEFLISASSLSGNAYGSFSVSLDKVELQSIAYGDTVDVEFDEGNSAVYFGFEGQIGDIVSVDVNSDNGIDTSLTLNSPDNYMAASDDDGGDGFDPEINQFNLSQTGTYTLVIRPYTPGDTGSVSLTLEKGVATSLDDGPQEIRLSDKQYQGYLTFEGQAGENIRMSVSVKSGENPAPNITVTQNGTTVTSVSGNTVGEVSFTFTVPADGPVGVQIVDYNYANSVLEVSIERVDGE
jgi:hypothetical protein